MALVTERSSPVAQRAAVYAASMAVRSGPSRAGFCLQLPKTFTMRSICSFRPLISGSARRLAQRQGQAPAEPLYASKIQDTW